MKKILESAGRRLRRSHHHYIVGARHASPFLNWAHLSSASFVFLLFWLCCGCLFAEDTSISQSIEKSRMTVEAFDRTGHLLRSGLGFFWDEGTVVCSYGDIKGASVVKVEASGFKGYANRVVSYNDTFDIAVLKVEEEMPVETQLGSSDMLAAGDSVYFFAREHNSWQLAHGQVRGWIDSGEGYEMIRLQPFPHGTAENEASPLFSSGGKVVGWLSKGTDAVPLESIGTFIGDKTSSVSLTEINEGGQTWALQKRKATATPDDRLELSEVKTIRGPAQFPFEVGLPVDWSLQTLSQKSRFLLRASDKLFGISVELRILPQETEDLMAAISRAETLIFSGMSCSDLTPYTADHLTGFKARYQDPSAEYSINIFYAMSKSHFYVLSVICPRKYEEDIKPLVEQIVSSLKI